MWACCGSFGSNCCSFGSPISDLGENRSLDVGIVLFIGGDVIFLKREAEDCASLTLIGDGERESELILDKGVLGGEVDFSLARKLVQF